MAVRWLIIVFILCLIPSSYLITWANYSFVHRNNKDDKQRYLIFFKNEKKRLTKEEISDNKEIDMDSEEVEESDEVVKDEIEKREDNETAEVKKLNQKIQVVFI